MFRHSMTAAALAAMSAGTAVAGEALEINNTYPINEQTFRLSDRLFFTMDDKGSSEVVKGPFQNGPTHCLGSGFIFPGGRMDISGICIFGEGADTFTMAWKTGGQTGAANTWKIVAGTGKYAGMTGEGMSTSGTVKDFRALPLRETHFSGTVDLPGQ